MIGFSLHFPSVLRVEGGTYVTIRKLSIDVYAYINRYTTYTLNTMADCNAQLLFTDVMAWILL